MSVWCCVLVQILDISAIVLANLCVSYIMTSQNEEVVILLLHLPYVMLRPYTFRGGHGAAQFCPVCFPRKLKLTKAYMTFLLQTAESRWLHVTQLLEAELSGWHTLSQCLARK